MTLGVAETEATPTTRARAGNTGQGRASGAQVGVVPVEVGVVQVEGQECSRWLS